METDLSVRSWFGNLSSISAGCRRDAGLALEVRDHHVDRRSSGPQRREHVTFHTKLSVGEIDDERRRREPGAIAKLDLDGAPATSLLVVGDEVVTQRFGDGPDLTEIFGPPVSRAQT